MMQILIFIFMVLVLQRIMSITTMSRNNNLEDFYKNHDWFQVARCEAGCLDLKMNDLRMCINWCLSEDLEKPGGCPKDNEIYQSIICRETCKDDVHCPMNQKCCIAGCNASCKNPMESSTYKNLPPIPKTLTIGNSFYKSQQRKRQSQFHNRFKKHRQKSIFQIRWKFDGTNDINKSYSDTIVYILEQQPLKRDRKIKNKDKEEFVWTPCAHSRQHTIRLQKKIFHPGYWYHFRVSAVGANGTRGPSQPSYGYLTSLIPKPPDVPQNVIVTPRWAINNTLAVQLQWKPPKSDIPIDKYRIFWSRQLFDPHMLDAVIVRQQTISKPKTKIIIRNLEMPHLYFFQIQALSHFGSKRLESQKSGLVYNTTQIEKLPKILSNLPNKKNFVDDLRIDKVFIKNMTLNMRIKWKQNTKSTKYTITTTHYCKEGKFSSYHKKTNSLTKFPYYDLDDLKFNCRYKISVRKVLNGKGPNKETILNFKTPKCADFINKNDNMLC